MEKNGLNPYCVGVWSLSNGSKTVIEAWISS